MCGIIGFVDLQDADTDCSQILGSMTHALTHRGPDDEGQWTDRESGVALGHRRLAILDLSREGHQPMMSRNGRYITVFNGEIYNFGEIRRELESLGHNFRGGSDTEVMLAAFEQWDVQSAVKRFVGMFAFALWDKTERALWLGRDRIGEKPLYYGWMGKVFLFGSELKALCAHPDWNGEIDRDVLALYLRHSYVPAPHSIYRAIRKLMPGTILRLSFEDISRGVMPEPVAYWSARDVAETAIASPFTGSDEEAIEQLDQILRRAVRQQMVSDVPLGAFLSGGVDSSIVVALMQAESLRPVRTFTIGFCEKDYDEAAHARAIARHLGTDHTELYVTSREAINVIPHLATVYDEPFSDSSQIPTLLVSKLARSRVTVSLSGDGGDELFFGYLRYKAGIDLWKKVGALSAWQRRILARTIRAIPVGMLNTVFGWAAPLFARYGRPGPAGDKLHKVADAFSVATPEAMYRRLCSHWKETDALIRDATEPLTAFTDPARRADIRDFAQRMMFVDTISYLPDDILVKLDRASMSVGLESRVPLLDHRVVEFALQLPMSMKLRDGHSKWLLRQLLYRYVPNELIERPKMGFGVPIGHWLCGPLRDWAEDLIDERRLRDDGFFDPGAVREKWKEHLSGRQNWQAHLWDVLMFQSWLARQRGSVERVEAARLSPIFASSLQSRVEPSVSGMD